MGIHDREYYRDETRGGLWFSGDAPACRAIIAANIVAFILQKFYRPGFDLAFVATSDQIFNHYQVWRLLTATFLHASPMHLLMNMLFLWMVGREMEHIYGTRDFLAFYLTAGVVSTLSWAVCDRLGGPEGMGFMLGASGAVMAVVVVFTLFYPRREILLFFLFPVEMWFLLVLYIGSDLLNLLTQSAEPVAYASHLGGAAYGYLYKVVDLRFSTLERWAARRRRPKLRIVAPDPPPKPTPVARPTVAPSRSSSMASPAAAARPTPNFVIPEEQIEERLDAILAKIAREGKAALSEEDNRILDEASRRFRNRRSERL